MKLLNHFFAFAATGVGLAVAKTGPLAAAYIEVNTNSLLNVGAYTLADGSNVFDIATIFASNIKQDDQGLPYVYHNPNVQALLSDAANQVRPLQAKGIKVLLSLLGGGTGLGIANFQTEQDADRFAGLIRDEITKYGLDGIDLDDEYAEYGEHDGTPPTNQQSIEWLVSSLRRDMPDKLISFYNIGPAADALSASDPSIGSQINYAWNPYYGSFQVPSIPGLDKQYLSPAAVSFSATSQDTAVSLAQQTVSEGYGAFLTYDLHAGDNSAYISAFTQVLYGQQSVYHAPATKRVVSKAFRG